MHSEQTNATRPQYPYEVFFLEKQGDYFSVQFECMATDIEDATDQAIAHYQGDTPEYGMDIQYVTRLDEQERGRVERLSNRRKEKAREAAPIARTRERNA